MPLTQVSSRLIEDTLRYVLGAVGSVAYTFTGKGLNGAVNDPTLTLSRGHTYVFENRNSNGAHPFYIKTSIANGGTNDAYNTGVTNNGGAGGTEIVFTVPHDAPDLLYYQCSSHSSMAGELKIAGAVADGSITTAKLADTAVTEAKLGNFSVTANKLGANAVTTDKIPDNAVTNAKIVNDAVTTAKIIDDAITGDKINAAAVSTSHIADSSITTAKIADSAITAAKLASGVGGKILQVVHFRKGDHASATIAGSSSGSNDWNYTGFSPAITPSATSSKIMMVGHLSMGGDTTALHIEIMVNGNYSAGGPNGDSNGLRRLVHTSGFIEYDRNVTPFPINFVFSPNSTSTQTYNFRFNHDSTTNKTIYINRSTNSDNNQRQGDAICHITLLEIAG